MTVAMFWCVINVVCVSSLVTLGVWVYMFLSTSTLMWFIMPCTDVQKLMCLRVRGWGGGSSTYQGYGYLLLFLLSVSL